jgi:hypothetical protein
MKRSIWRLSLLPERGLPSQKYAATTLSVMNPLTASRQRRDRGTPDTGSAPLAIQCRGGDTTRKRSRANHAITNRGRCAQAVSGVRGLGRMSGQLRD